MRANPLKAILNRGDAVLTAWLSIPSAVSAETMGHLGYDAATLDLQHGLFSFEQTLGIFQALSSTPAVPMARVDGNDAVAIGRVLDAGAYGIICPMINSAAEARAFVSACRYHPVGTRSYGPARGQLYGGADYFPKANGEILAIGMVETRAGLEALDEILAVDGLDGIFVGPNDLAIAFGKMPVSESDDPEIVAAIAHIRARTRAAGKIAGILASSGPAAVKRMAQGFNFVTSGGDAGLMTAGARNSVGIVREAMRAR